MKTTVQKWGKSLAVRIPQNVVQKIGLHLNDVLTIEVQQGRIVLIAVEKNGAVPLYRLGDLVKKITLKNRYKEVDFGHPVGSGARRCNERYRAHGRHRYNGPAISVSPGGEIGRRKGLKSFEHPGGKPLA